MYQLAKVSIEPLLSYALISKISMSNSVSGNWESSCPPFGFYSSEKRYPVMSVLGYAFKTRSEKKSDKGICIRKGGKR